MTKTKIKNNNKQKTINETQQRRLKIEQHLCFAIFSLLCCRFLNLIKTQHRKLNLSSKNLIKTGDDIMFFLTGV